MHLLQSGYLSHFCAHWQRPICIQVYVGQSAVYAGWKVENVHGVFVITLMDHL